MKTITLAAIAVSSILGAVGAASWTTSRVTGAPPELGQVHWERSFDKAAERAKRENKLILVLFQEVPGCATCVNYGQSALSHPLVVEAIETLFVPVAVFNNHGGEDRKTLGEFREPAWNNPVIRIVRPDRSDVVRRVNADFSTGRLVGAIVEALGVSNTPVPEYLKLLHAEVSNHSPQKVLFAMPCFWTGEAKLGGLAGVTATRPGFSGGHEVVEVTFDPSVVSREIITANAESMGLAPVAMGPVRPDGDPQYYLSRNSLRHLPMTPLQATRVNAALGTEGNPERFLSPRQIELAAMINASPGGGWGNIYRKEITEGWTAALDQLNLLGRISKAL